MLNPNSRSLYTSSLTPPPGMVFDEAIATTFSMDPVLLLEAQIYLALMAAERQTEPDPLLILEAIRRHSKKISVYVQKGRIQIPQISKSTPLFGLLEEMVIEVKSPRGGVFHPKVWAIRFVNSDRSKSILRLIILTKNMTTDQSWDLSLQLEGTIKRRKEKNNKPLAHFFKILPSLTTGIIEEGQREQAHRFSRDIHRTQWELPDGFDKLAFYLPGTEKFNWVLPEANRMAVVSPFCSDEALQILVNQSNSAEALISSPEVLAGLQEKTLNLFSQCRCLDEKAETEDGEESEPSNQPLATGLHAKAYLFETHYNSDYTHVILGSANATNAALVASKNVEILVELVGRKNEVGGIDDLLGEDGLGEYLIELDTTKEYKIDVETQEAEACIRKARRLLVDTEIFVQCQKASRENLWTLTLNGQIPPLDGIDHTSAWPITVAQEKFAVIIPTDNAFRIPLGEFSASSITGLTAFELKIERPNVSARFVLNLPVDGIPDERKSAILQTVISNHDDFIQYLLLLLGDDTTDANFKSGSGTGIAKWLSGLVDGEEVPLLEEMTRAYGRYPERLHEISRLVGDLSFRNNPNTIIPEEFLSLWSTFSSALSDHNGK